MNKTRPNPPQSPADDLPLLTARQVAHRLTVTEGTVRRYVRQGLLEPVRIGRTLRFTHASIAAVVHPEKSEGTSPQGAFAKLGAGAAEDVARSE